MIEGAFFALLLFFFVLGFFHGHEEVEVNGKRYRAAPAFQPLALVLPLALILAFLVPGIGALVATAVEPAAATIHVQQTTNGTLAVTYTSKPPAASSMEPSLTWQYWVYVLSIGLFPLGGYYTGYNLAMWIDARQTLPILIRYPIFKIVEEKPREEVVVEELPRKKREEETYIILKGDPF